MNFLRATRVFTIAGLALCLYLIGVSAQPDQKASAFCACNQKQIPLYEPNLTNTQLLNWATEAAVTSFTFDYEHFRAQLQSAASFFTPAGWQLFISGLQKSNNLNIIQKYQLVGSAIPYDKPTITWLGQVSGVFAWKVDVPLLVIYKNDANRYEQKMIVSLFIHRSSNYVGRDDIGILEFNAKEVI